MSRTDKDVPWWVAAEEYEPDHWCCTDDLRHLLCRERRDCDLPPEPVRQPPRKRRFPTRHCVWYPIWPREYRYFRGNPPSWYRHHYWYDPERNNTRADVRKMIKEHRATGEVDTIPSTNQHRHCSTWAWW